MRNLDFFITIILGFVQVVQIHNLYGWCYSFGSMVAKVQPYRVVVTNLFNLL